MWVGAVLRPERKWWSRSQSGHGVDAGTRGRWGHPYGTLVIAFYSLSLLCSVSDRIDLILFFVPSLEGRVVSSKETVLSWAGAEAFLQAETVRAGGTCASLTWVDGAACFPKWPSRLPSSQRCSVSFLTLGWHCQTFLYLPIWWVWAYITFFKKEQLYWAIIYASYSSPI